jgi:hypothetical protein
MYLMSTTPTPWVDPTNGLESSEIERELQPPGRARRWRGYLAAFELFGATAVVIAAPLADRETVPATFVDQIGAAFDADMPGTDEFSLPTTSGEPTISLATAQRER